MLSMARIRHKCQMMKISPSSIICTIAILATSLATAEERKPVDPSGPYARRAGRITQLDSAYDQGLPSNELPLTGNAAIIDPCRIITNFHIAFGKSEIVDTGRLIMVRPVKKGREVNFFFDLDTSGNFKRTLKAKVLAFGTYVKTDTGIRGDVTVLELETCLDKKSYEALDLVVPDTQTDGPVGILMTVSVAFTANGKNEVLIQEGCQADKFSPIDGIFLSNCESKAGMSGSIIYELGTDDKWHWTGLHTAGNGKNRSVAIAAKTIAALLRANELGP